MLPGFVLKKMIMDNFQSSQVDPDVADGIDFMVERVGLFNFYKVTFDTDTFSNLEKYNYYGVLKIFRHVWMMVVVFMLKYCALVLIRHLTTDLLLVLI